MYICKVYVYTYIYIYDTIHIYIYIYSVCMLSHVGPMFFFKAGTHDMSTDATDPLLPLSQGPSLLQTQQGL